MMTLVWSSRSRDKADRVRKYLSDHHGLDAETGVLYVVRVPGDDAGLAMDLIADATDEGGD